MMNLFSRFNERGPGAPGQCLSPSLFLSLSGTRTHAARQHDATAIHAAIARNEVTYGVVPRETPHVATDLGASQTAQSHGGMNVALDLSTLQN
jgi:hypothetical protein